MKSHTVFLLVCLVATVLSAYATKDDHFTSVGPSKFENAVFAQTRRVKRGCWNYFTGSRCDNEGFWGSVGYDTCEEKYGGECRRKGRRGAYCSKATERCFGLTRNAKVCTCY
ncbi:unnamed protein product, partial [Mesorhabditis belari]|uniref:Uncharacterized protein n=1 Tax=Mesorhabditis belari TaxID=2138241 RepID=A0AAF3FAR1_9BILA